MHTHTHTLTHTHAHTHEIRSKRSSIIKSAVLLNRRLARIFMTERIPFRRAIAFIKIMNPN